MHFQIHRGPVTNKAYVHQLGGAQWIEVASMSEVRRGPSCGVVRNQGTDKEEVVVAAGWKP